MGFHLLDNPNRHATAAGYGGFWGHPTRLGASVRLVVVHTSESAFDRVGADDGAENVARYLDSTSRTASYHTIVDADSTVELLPFTHTAFGARGHNRHAIHVAVAGTAAGWTALTSTYRDRVIDRLADVVADALAWADVPAVRLVGSQARDDGRGICGHADLDPARRTDPGVAFPWNLLFDRLKDDDMTPEESEMLARIHAELTSEDQRGTIARYVATTNAAVGRMERVHGGGLAGLATQGVDVAALADEIAGQLDVADAQALADELARRLSS